MEPCAVEPTPQSLPDVQHFRHNALALQAEMQVLVADGQAEAPHCPLTHYFVPKDAKYGCVVYAREIFLPKDSVIVGKIHRHTHLAFLLKGKVDVVTEHGRTVLEAPCTFISEAGVKRVLYVEEDAIVTTVHLTEHEGEEWLHEIEQEVIAPTYEALEAHREGGPL
jgi:hypothetical protein